MKISVLAALAMLTGSFLAAQSPDKEEESVKPGINKNFLDPNLVIEDWLGRFEVESREVYHCREEVVTQLGITQGMTVADIGAGTGLYMQAFAEAAGRQGKVYAVDISEVFLKHLRRRAEKLELKQVETVLGSDKSVKLPEESVDLMFICDTYHHFEYPEATMASIWKAVKPGGRLALIDFERIPGVTREWLLGHVRAGKEVFVDEIEQAGFEKIKELTLAGFKENYFVIFRKKAS